MKKLFALAPLALVALPLAAAPASADEVTIRTRHDNGLHRGWDHAPAYGARRVIIRKQMRGDMGTTRVTKKVTRTNEFGDRVTKKVTREVD